MWVISIFIALLLALIPANIASKKGRSFGLWYLYGFLLWIVALIHSLAISDESGNKITNVAWIKEETVYNTIKEVSVTSVDINAKVRIQSWIIEKDSNEKVFLRISVFNTTQKEISALNIKIKGYDSFNNLISINDDESFSILIQDLQLFAKNSQMIDNRIALPNSNIRKVELFIQQVCYKNGDIEKFPEPCFVKPCQECLSAQYLPYAKKITEQAEYYMIEKPEYWQCLCGEINTESVCLKCGIPKAEARRFSKSGAQFTYEEYLKEEEKIYEAEKAAELEREEEKKQCIENLKEKIKSFITIRTLSVLIVIVIAVGGIGKQAFNAYNEWKNRNIYEPYISYIGKNVDELPKEYKMEQVLNGEWQAIKEIEKNGVNFSNTSGKISYLYSPEGNSDLGVEPNEIYSMVWESEYSSLDSSTLRDIRARLEKYYGAFDEKTTLNNKDEAYKDKDDHFMLLEMLWKNRTGMDIKMQVQMQGVEYKSTKIIFIKVQDND